MTYPGTDVILSAVRREETRCLENIACIQKNEILRFAQDDKKIDLT
jgi:hypothetical protein